MLVIKVGGGADIDLDSFLTDIATLAETGKRLVLVHGGNAACSLLQEQLGHPPRMVTSISGHTSRYTDARTMEIFNMAYAGQVNTRIVARLQALGVNAVGLSGVDGRLFEGKRKTTLKIVEGGKRKILRGDHTGRVEKVNTHLIETLLEGGYLPVVTPPAISYEHDPINVDGDRAAAQLAGALGAEALLIFSNVPGLLKDVEDPDSRIDHIARREVDGAMAFAKGRFKRKILGAVEALDMGLGKVIIADARAETPVQRALAGDGTVIA